MLYNQQIATTTSYDLFDTPTGYSVKITTFGYFDTIIYFLIPITIIFVVGLFKKKK